MGTTGRPARNGMRDRRRRVRRGAVTQSPPCPSHRSGRFCGTTPTICAAAGSSTKQPTVGRLLGRPGRRGRMRSACTGPQSRISSTVPSASSSIQHRDNDAVTRDVEAAPRWMCVEIVGDTPRSQMAGYCKLVHERAGTVQGRAKSHGYPWYCRVPVLSRHVPRRRH